MFLNLCKSLVRFNHSGRPRTSKVAFKPVTPFLKSFASKEPLNSKLSRRPLGKPSGNPTRKPLGKPLRKPLGKPMGKSRIISVKSRPRTFNEFTFSTKYPRQKLIRIPVRKPSSSSQPDSKLKPELRLASFDTTFDEKFDLDIVKTKGIKTLDSFDGLPLHCSLLDAFKALNYTKPTNTQAHWLPALLNSKSEAILCAAETGTGKTLAYMSYLMHHLKTEEDQVMAKPAQFASDNIPKGMLNNELPDTYQLSKLRRLKRPRAIVLVPSKELVSYIGEVAKGFSHHVHLRVLKGSSSPDSNRALKKKLLDSPVDLMVTTPGLLLSLVKDNLLSLSELRWMVLDEADTLFDTLFSKDMNVLIPLIQKIQSTQKSSFQCILSTATVPKTLSSGLSAHFKDLITIATPNVHKTVPGLTQQFYKLHPGISKEHMLLYVLRKAVSETHRLMIFCNTTTRVDQVTAYLKSKGYNVLGMTRTITDKAKASQKDLKDRSEWLSEFAKVPVLAGQANASGLTYDNGRLNEQSQDEQPVDTNAMILVATDVASRGLDTCQVGHVVLYDFPVSPIDYLHRVGRTARNGKAGRATSIVSRHDIAKAAIIEKAVKNRLPLS